MTSVEVPLQVGEGTVDDRPQVSAFRLFARNRAALFGLVLLLLILVAETLGPLVYPHTAQETVGAALLPPGSSAAPLGTDEIGRDVLAGLLTGGRVTFAVGVFAAALSAFIGLVFGSLAGYYGGIVDAVLMRITEFFQVLPPILLAIVLVALFQPSAVTIVVAIGVVTWPGTARLARAEFLRIREAEFVKGSRAVGASDVRLMLKVILPNAMPPLVVYTTLIVGMAMLFEAGLSFVGVGDPNALSWGTMLGDNRDKILVAWWPVVLPGLAIFLSVLSVSLVGDGLNDAMNPKGRER